MALVQRAQELLTISTSVKNITASLFEDSDSQPLNIIRGLFAWQSGGNIYHSSNDSAPANDGTDGSIPEFSTAKPKFIINGLRDLKAWAAIKQSGEADSLWSIVLEGPDV